MTISAEQCGDLIGHCWRTQKSEWWRGDPPNAVGYSNLTERETRRSCRHCGLVQVWKQGPWESHHEESEVQP